MDNNIWGWHYSLNAIGDKEAIKDKQLVHDFVKLLVERIDMKAFGEPQIVYFAGHDPSKAGFTLSQLIETSNISCHFVDATGEIYLDVFSCKPFDKNTARFICDMFFKFGDNYNEWFLTRKAGKIENV